MLSLIAQLLISVVLAPDVDFLARKSALEVLGQLQTPLDKHADGLIRLSADTQLTDELTVVFRNCVALTTFYQVIDRTPLDALNTSFVLDVHYMRVDDWQRREGSMLYDDRIKKFLYRVILFDPESAPRAVVSLAEWCHLTVFDRMALHYIMWFGRIDVRVAAVATLSHNSNNSFLCMMGLLDCLSVARDPWQQIKLLHSIHELGVFAKICARNIDFDRLLCSDNHNVIANAITKMLDYGIYSWELWWRVFLLTVHSNRHVRRLALSWLEAAYSHLFRLAH